MDGRKVIICEQKEKTDMAFQLLTWERFITTNLDPRGVESKFEDLCRQLFINEYLSQNKLVKYDDATINRFLMN